MHHFFRSCLLLLSLFLAVSCGSNVPDEIGDAYAQLPEKIDFNFHVRPILSDRCFHCHGPDEAARKGDLRLDTREALTRQPTVENGRAARLIVPGKPLESDLVLRLFHEDPDVVMPPPESGLMLTSEEKATLIKWIEQGAEYKDHWAFTAPVKPVLPEVSAPDWPQNPIDHFVLAALDHRGLTPSPAAERRTLIRRVSLDLTGLPPTPEEVRAFEEDDSPGAYEKLVDRLLARPAFGERWAWEWMDVARYSDTNGFQGDPTRTMWPWRDWVIRAFNDNMPYDEFTVRQLAGDLLPDATAEDTMATAFNRNHPYNGEGGKIAEEVRVNNVFDRVETTATTWLALTMNCARCHDHKYDAISQREYYQLYDYFNQTSEEGWGKDGQVTPVIDMSPIEDRQKLAALTDFMKQMTDKVEAYEKKKFPRPEGKMAAESAVAKSLVNIDLNLLSTRPGQRFPYHFFQLAERFVKDDPAYAALLAETYAANQAKEAQAAKNLRVMVMDERKQARVSTILSRGTYDRPLDTVHRNVPDALPPLPDGVKNDRLAFANWLVSEEQPLTARVTVNRYWQAFFGYGIVKTIADFGVQGELPTHPDLLDWLAVDFQENGWNLKRLFKTIVMSGTYRQSSAVSPELLALDPENRYLARASRRRLPAWMMRDQALAAGGLLVDSVGGAPVKPYQPAGVWAEATFGKIKYEQDHGAALYRRSLYTFHRRIAGPTYLFDNSNRQLCAVRDYRTNTPLHALTTLNDVTYTEAARVLAQRTLRTARSDEERITAVFTVVTARPPNEEELSVLENRLSSLRAEYAADPAAARQVIDTGEYPQPAGIDTTDHAAYTLLCSVIMNLDEAINRQ